MVNFLSSIFDTALFLCSFSMDGLYLLNMLDPDHRWERRLRSSHNNHGALHLVHGVADEEKIILSGCGPCSLSTSHRILHLDCSYIVLSQVWTPLSAPIFLSCWAGRLRFPHGAAPVEPNMDQAGITVSRTASDHYQIILSLFLEVLLLCQSQSTVPSIWIVVALCCWHVRLMYWIMTRCSE
jgi:hypothetical protein